MYTLFASALLFSVTHPDNPNTGSHRKLVAPCLQRHIRPPQSHSLNNNKLDILMFKVRPTNQTSDAPLIAAPVDKEEIRALRSV